MIATSPPYSFIYGYVHDDVYTYFVILGIMVWCRSYQTIPFYSILISQEVRQADSHLCILSFSHQEGDIPEELKRSTRQEFKEFFKVSFECCLDLIAKRKVYVDQVSECCSTIKCIYVDIFTLLAKYVILHESPSNIKLRTFFFLCTERPPRLGI